MDSLLIYKNKYNKIRLGSEYDGGYIICDLPEKYDLFISCGIENNIDFELDFINKYNIKCNAYDGTINKIPVENCNIIFNKKNIGIENTEYTTNLIDTIEKYNNIFLKMDIETYEFNWFNILDNNQIKKFKQIVVEFHFPFTDYALPQLDKPSSSDFKINILEKIAKTHYLVHLHPNTACGTIEYNKIKLPNVFECTYVRKDSQENIGFNVIPIPHPLDRKNRKEDIDIFLSGYPFTI